MEIQSIVKKRTDYEYTLKRRQLELADVYEYIRYEVNLELLRELRTFKLNEKANKEVRDALRNLQASFFRHICSVFERAIRRFPAEQSVWSDYVEFLKKKNASATLSTVIGRALSLFPKNEDFWLEAASHEIHANNSIQSARTLLLRALRVNGKSKAIWKKYFTLELWNLARSGERKKVLGIEDPNLIKTESLAKAPLIAFRYAMGAIPDDIGFALELYELTLGSSVEVAGVVLAEMKTLFRSNSQFWWLLCRRRLIQRSLSPIGMSSPAAWIAFVAEICGSAMDSVGLLREGCDVIFRTAESSTSSLVQTCEEVEVRSKRRRFQSDVAKVRVGCSESVMLAGVPDRSSATFFAMGLSDVLEMLLNSINNIVNISRSYAVSDVLVAVRIIQKTICFVEELQTSIFEKCCMETSLYDSLQCTMRMCMLRLYMLKNLSKIIGDRALLVGSRDIPLPSSGKKRKAKNSVDERLHANEAVNCGTASSFRDTCIWLMSYKGSSGSDLSDSGSAMVNVGYSYGGVVHLCLSLALDACNVSGRKLSFTGTDTKDFELPAHCELLGETDEGTLWEIILTLSRFVARMSGSRLMSEKISAPGLLPEECSDSKSFQDALRLVHSVLSGNVECFVMDVDSDRQIVISSLREAIRNRHCSPSNRIKWMCEYISREYFGGESIAPESESRAVPYKKMGRSAYEWCWTVLSTVPGHTMHIEHARVDCRSEKFKPLLSNNLTLPIIEIVLKLEKFEEFLTELEKLKLNGLVYLDSMRDDINFFRSVLERGIENCDLSSTQALSDFHIRLMRANGDHKTANSVAWRLRRK